VGADKTAVTEQGLGLDPGIEQRRVRRQAQGIGEKGGDLLRYFAQQRELAELLACLEHDQEGQSGTVADALLEGERSLLVRGSELRLQLLVAQLFGQSGIGGSVD